jgi:DNA-binding NtrC family response regulator
VVLDYMLPDGTGLDLLAPLRQRGEDIVLLAQHYCNDFAARLGKQLTLHREVCELLLHYDFPGNVRELRNLMERAVILATPASAGAAPATAATSVVSSVITPDLLPPRIAEMAVQRRITPAAVSGNDEEAGLSASTLAARAEGGLTVTFEPGRDTLENLERRLLEEALRMAGGKKVKAAEILGISRFALLRRVEKYGL